MPQIAIEGERALRRLTDIEQRTATYLLQEHGPILDGRALAEVLRYPTMGALERSLQRGHLQLRIINLPGRRGVFVHALELARYLAEQVAQPQAEAELSKPASDRDHQPEKGG